MGAAHTTIAIYYGHDGRPSEVYVEGQPFTADAGDLRVRAEKAEGLLGEQTSIADSWRERAHEVERQVIELKGERDAQETRAKDAEASAEKEKGKAARGWAAAHRLDLEVQEKTAQLSFERGRPRSTCEPAPGTVEALNEACRLIFGREPELKYRPEVGEAVASLSLENHHTHCVLSSERYAEVDALRGVIRYALGQKRDDQP